MQGDYKKMFWTKFDKELKLVPELILSGMTNDLFKSEIKESSFRINDFNPKDFIAINIYNHFGSTLLVSNDLNNDIQITAGKVNSINLNNYLSSSDLFMREFSSFDIVHASKYRKGEYNFNYAFSYLLGNFIRYYNDGKLIIPNYTNRLYILTNLIEDFNYRNNLTRLIISRGMESSFIELENEELLNRLNANVEFLKTTTANNV